MKNKTWIILLAAALALCLGLSAFLLFPGEKARRAVIRSDGKVIATVDLHVDQEMTVKSEKGTNVVTVRDGKVAVTSADCPDHYCMHRGFCDGGTPIVCLPNKLVIEFLGDQEIDGAVG